MNRTLEGRLSRLEAGEQSERPSTRELVEIVDLFDARFEAGQWPDDVLGELVSAAGADRGRVAALREVARSYEDAIERVLAEREPSAS